MLATISPTESRGCKNKIFCGADFYQKNAINKIMLQPLTYSSSKQEKICLCQTVPIKVEVKYFFEMYYMMVEYFQTI